MDLEAPLHISELNSAIVFFILCGTVLLRKPPIEKHHVLMKLGEMYLRQFIFKLFG